MSGAPSDRPPGREKRDPRKPLPPGLAPPAHRSRAAHAFAAWAAEGALRLQRCTACGAWAYPPRDACPRCLETSLAWEPADPRAEVIAETCVRLPGDPFFRATAPWRVGTLRLKVGVTALAYLHPGLAVPGPARVVARLDRAGRAVLLALPPEGAPMPAHEAEAFAADPRGRRILIAQGRSPVAQPLAHLLLAAGAAEVMLGLPADGHPPPSDLGGVPVRLDPTDGVSVEEAAARLGGKVEILVNLADYPRPGSASALGAVETRRAFDVTALALARLAGAFAPAMAARAGETLGPAAIVDVLPAEALAPLPRNGLRAATGAARLALAAALRAELRAAGVRVLEVLSGPPDDPWHGDLPPPKVTPRQVAEAVLRALREGIERTYVGPVAEEIGRRWRRDPAALIREGGE